MVRALASRSVVLTAIATAALAGISILRFEVGEPGVMLFAVFPVALLGVMYGLRGGIAAAAIASAVFIVWATTRGHVGAIEEIDEPMVFFLFGLVTGMYAHGAFGRLDPREALRQAELRAAIERGEVDFYYQPLADAQTGRVVGLEALARWLHPRRGTIEPAGFIPLAERDEQTIWALTLLGLERTIAHLSRWGEAAAEISVSINLSSVSIGRRDLAAEFSRILARHAFPASKLAVEITETAVTDLRPEAAHRLGELKRLGVGIVLDDFGTGYSSIARLGSLPFDTIKVDLQLVGLPPQQDATRILKATLGTAQALGLQTVAERVEDDETWDELQRLGCDLVQGFRLCPPLPAGELGDWLRRPDQRVTRSST